MATKDRRKLQHIHSSIADKQPEALSLEVGEIAVNNSADKEFLSIKNSDDKVVRFSSDSTLIDWIENKEVVPYSGVVDNVHLDTNRSNIEIKINQVAAKNTPKYDKINGAVDIDGQPVNPSTDGGKTDGAGIAIDMSRYAMIGANPSFSSVTVTHQSNLSGTTNISNGAGGEVLNITTTNVNANDTDWTEIIANKKSTVTNETDNITTLNASATTATLSGNTLDITEATRLSAKTPSTYVSGTSLSVVETNTDIESCGRISGKTNTFTIQECATGSGKTVINQTDIKASGKTLSFDETTSISAKTPSTTLSGTELTITETTSTINSTNTNLTGTNLTISESNTSISSCTKLDIVSDDLNFGSCTTAGTIDFNFCNGFGVNSNNIKLHQCATAGTISISAQTQNINGGNLTVNESGNTAINTTGTTNIKSTGNTNVETNGANNKVTIQASGTGGDVEVFAKDTLCMSGGSTAAMVGTAKTNIGKNCSDGGQTTTLNLNGNTINESGTSVNISGTTTNISANTLNENVVGTTTINRSGTTTEYNRTGYTSNTTGDTCIQSTADVNVGGAANTNIGTNCDDTVKSNYVNIKASNTITETASTVTISGTNTVNVGGATINESGTTHNENFTNYDVNAGNDYCVSAATRANFYGKATNIGIDCNGTTIATATTIEGTTVNISGNTTNISGATNLNISGGTVSESGTTNNNNFTTINTTATTINNKVTNLNVSGTTTLSGDTTVGGKLYLKPDCTTISSNTVNAALCEILDRGEVTMTKDPNPSNSGLSAVYKLYQNGSQIGDDINVPKDGFLKNVELIESASTYYLHFVWNIFDADTQTYSTGQTYVNMEDLVKDIDDRNPSDTGSAANHNVVVDVHYDVTEKKMVVSAETTPTMHVTNMYATTNISGATVSGTNVNGATVSAGTLTATGNTTLAAASATSISATSISSPTISGTNITASTAIRANNVSASTISATTFTGAMSKKLTWTAGAFTADTTGYNGSADKTITVPTAISHLATRGKLTITHNGLSDTYDPASDKSMTLPHSALSFSYGSVSAKTGSDSYDTSAAKSITIPTSIDDLKNYNGTCVEIPHNVCVTGTITSSGAIYSSDMNLKENINDVERDDYLKAKHINAKSFNFKSDESKRKVYGVIAQDVQDVGLNNLVHTDEEGNLGVDYTSLLILKIAYLESLCNHLQGLYVDLNNKINEIENKG